MYHFPALLANSMLGIAYIVLGFIAILCILLLISLGRFSIHTCATNQEVDFITRQIGKPRRYLLYRWSHAICCDGTYTDPWEQSLCTYRNQRRMESMFSFLSGPNPT